jgi:hypothetical protein
VAAVAVNLVAVGPSGPGHLSAWPANLPTPVAPSSVLNYTAAAGLNLANGVILPLCDEVAADACASGDLAVLAAVSGTHFVADVVGYFTTPGRPNTIRRGTVGTESGLCTGPTGAKFGLSMLAVSWEGAAAACPLGTWVCTATERGTAACDTARPENGGCEALSCAGSCIDRAASNHFGWLAAPGNFNHLSGTAMGELGGTELLPTACEHNPVWCCSR